MHWIDFTIIFGYMAVVLGVGVFFFRKQASVDEYFVGDRKMTVGHISFSVVATDVGGGFSIGLGGLGFVMGLSGSWLLFTGLVGAWMAAIILIPKVKRLGDKFGFLTYPDYLENRFDGKTRLLAAIVSGIGYAGFVGAQVLAGAKLGSAVFDINLMLAVVVMAGVAVLYTSFGGIQAVIYTDSIQWMVLLCGLLFFAIPFGYVEVGGLAGMKEALPESHFSLTNVSAGTLLTWAMTIIPIWFIGMTLYQRIYAAKDLKTAKRAWYLAGLLEYPLMAFMGVLLGMFGRVMFPDVESEMALPMLIKEVLPIGLVGLVSAAYFSAIMSTADSCLIASVGNIVNDLYQNYINPKASQKKVLAISRWMTIIVGAASVAIALSVPKVLDSMLMAYAFMVSGLFAPTLGGLIWKRVSSIAALWSIIIGGGLSIILNVFPKFNPFDDAILLALPVSVVVLVVLSLIFPNQDKAKAEIADA